MLLPSNTPPITCDEWLNTYHQWVDTACQKCSCHSRCFQPFSTTYLKFKGPPKITANCVSPLHLVCGSWSLLLLFVVSTVFLTGYTPSCRTRIRAFCQSILPDIWRKQGVWSRQIWIWLTFCGCWYKMNTRLKWRPVFAVHGRVSFFGLGHRTGWSV